MRLILAIFALVAPLIVAAPSAAEEKPRRAEAQNARPRAARPRLSGSLLDRWRQLTPRQRQRALENLPPERRRAFEQRLNRLEKLSPEERRRLRSEYERFRRLSPDRQARYRQLYERFNQLPAARRPMVIREFRNLRDLSPEERERRLKSKEFQDRFEPAERKLLEEMAEEALE